MTDFWIKSTLHSLDKPFGHDVLAFLHIVGFDILKYRII